jgi:DNA-binding transcriptional LysR family regulator
MKRAFSPPETAKLPDLDWNDFRYVLAIARARAIAPAARSPRVDATTVARRLARVELALRTKLFERKDGRLLPTEAAGGVIERAERIEAEAAAIVEGASGVDAAVSGSVRLTAVPLIVSRLILPGLGALIDAHPGLMLEIIADARNLSVMRRDADIALRLARPDREQQAIARRLTHLSYAVYAPARRGARRLPWIAYAEDMASLPHVSWINRAMKREGSRPALIVNDSEAALHAIRQGYGKSLLPCIVADCETGLLRTSGARPVLQRELWLLVNPGLRRLARIEAVVTWIEELVAASHDGAAASRTLSRSLGRSR